tara:strand:- start:186 stop:794 length:609 start_codon:yes stop_codon:yes gene_type:complete
MKLFNYRINVLTFFIIAFVVYYSIQIYRESDVFQLKCIISDVDGKKYCVREKHDMERSADLLAKTTVNLKKLVDKVGKEYPDKENVKRLVKGFDPKKVYEILPTSEYTAYSENKGEKLAFCLTKSKHGDTLIEEDTLLFVGIHELAHIMTKSIGHHREFWANFKFLLINAKKYGIHQPKDYKENPVTYCSMDITDNPYYDFK